MPPILNALCKNKTFRPSKGIGSTIVFGSLRKAVSLTGTHITLTTAEIIAAVYYPALRDATNSKILKQLCTQIIQDEDQHLAFQAAVIKKMQAAQPYWLTRIGGVGWRLFLALTTAVVWLDHKKVFKAAGVSYANFGRKALWFIVASAIKFDRLSCCPKFR